VAGKGLVKDDFEKNEIPQGSELKTGEEERERGKKRKRERGKKKRQMGVK